MLYLLSFETTTQLRSDETKQILLYFILLLKHFVLLFKAQTDVFEKNHDKDQVLDMLVKVNCQVSAASHYPLHIDIQGLFVHEQY